MKYTAAFVLLILLATGSPLWAATFQTLGDLPGGEYSSSATAISANGKVVIGVAGSTISYDGDDDNGQAFRWTQETGMQALGVAPGVWGSWPRGISADGSLIVGNSAGIFFWRESTGMTAGPTIDLFGVARSLSSDGVTIVGHYDNQVTPNDEAYRWTAAGGITTLGHVSDLPYYSSYAMDTSADGTVIVGWGRSNVEQGGAFRWTESTGMQRLQMPAAFPIGVATSVSADGSTIVGNMHAAVPGTGPQSEAFRWTAEHGALSLGDLGEEKYGVRPLALSANGSVIVGAYLTQGAGYGDAFIWDEAHGMRNLQEVLTTEFALDFQGWKLTDAVDISDDGRTIVGTAYHSVLDVVEAYVVTIPEPSAIFLLLMGVVIVGCTRVWHRR